PFDEAFEHAEAALRVADTAAQPFTLYNVLFSLGLARLRRGDLARAIQALARSVEGGRTGQLVREIQVAATLGVAYALAGRVEEALVLTAGAVERGDRHRRTWWTVALLGAAAT